MSNLSVPALNVVLLSQRCIRVDECFNCVQTEVAGRRLLCELFTTRSCFHSQFAGGRSKKRYTVYDC